MQYFSGNRRRQSIVVALVLLAISLGLGWRTLLASSFPRGFSRHFFRAGVGEAAMPYTLFLPADFPKSAPYPLIISLHGFGERGIDGVMPTKTGLAKFVKAREADFSFAVLFPQSRSGLWSPSSNDGRNVLKLIAYLESTGLVDPSRECLTGVSSGSVGVWEMACEYPDRWAAIVPLAGSQRLIEATRISRIPCWAFQNVNDDVAPVRGMRGMIEALRKAGGSPNYTEFKGSGSYKHNVWDEAYAMPELFTWLLEQRSARSDRH